MYIQSSLAARNETAAFPLSCLKRAMPELPDVDIYIEALDSRIRGARIEKVELDRKSVV